jgi:hypothetical protein
VQSQQLPTESQVFEDEVLAGTESADHPPEEMPERHDHGKHLIGKAPIKLFAKSFILQVYEVLARHREFGVLADQRKLNKPFRLADGKIAEEQCIDEREDRRIRADSKGEGKHRDDREAGILAQDTNGVAQILQEVRHGHPPLKIQSWDALSTLTLTEELFQHARHCGLGNEAGRCCAVQRPTFVQHRRDSFNSIHRCHP